MAVFLRENGVLTMGNKTPVTILQETLQRRGLIPHYELIYNGVGTMDPVFKFQVSAAGFTAIGDGKSKKEAKHDAAAALLKRMQTNKAVTESSEVEATEEVDIASPYSGALKQNFVGMLDETCVINKIPLPMFVPISEDGPPHARIFTMQCRVSTCSETAVARTKKQAKHMVAQQMIGRVADILGDKYIPVTEKPTELEDLNEERPNLRAIESGNFRHDLSVSLAELQNVFYHRTEEFLVPQLFLDLPLEPEEFYEQMENPKEFLEKLLQGLEGTCKTVLTSVTSLKEVIQEIEKDCEMFWWGEKEDEEEKQFVLTDEDDESSWRGKYNLKEFDLDDDFQSPNSNDLTSDSHSGKHVEDSSLTSPDQLVIPKTQDETLIKPNCETKDSLTAPVILFLSLECPQGSWSFIGQGETRLAAENQGAVKALVFLRALSIPSCSRSKAVTAEVQQ